MSIQHRVPVAVAVPVPVAVAVPVPVAIPVPVATLAAPLPLLRVLVLLLVLVPLLLLLLLPLASCSDSASPVVDLGAVDRPAREAGKDQTMDRPADLAAIDLKPSEQPPTTGPLRVGTLNLHCLEDQPDLRAQGIAAEVQNHDLDAMALQEICESVGSGGSDNMGGKLTAALRTATGIDWEVRWTQTHVAWYGKYNEGIGILARKGAFLASGDTSLFKAPDDFPRKVIWAKISTPRGLFYMYSTHLTTSSDWTARNKEVQGILDLARTQLGDNLPQIVAGDFNDKDGSGPLQTMRSGPPLFTDSWVAKNPGLPGNSIGCPNPSSRIDYIMIRSAALKSLSKVEQLAKQYQGVCLSDHVGLWAELFPSY